MEICGYSHFILLLKKKKKEDKDLRAVYLYI